jgi:hypothetical protein
VEIAMVHATRVSANTKKLITPPDNNNESFVGTVVEGGAQERKRDTTERPMATGTME